MTDTMFFVVSKLVGVLIRTETWIVLSLGFIALALVLNWHGVAKFVGLLAFGFFLVMSILPIGDLVLRPLERTYPAFPDLTDVDGIVVLGGGRGPSPWRQPGTDECADRYISAVFLAQRFPDAKIIFSGGFGRLRDLIGSPATDTNFAKRIFLSRGVSADRLILDDLSRNTTENARRSFELAQPEVGETWILVTSAYHMRRAMRSFERAGWDNIVPYPVDYRSRRFSVALGWNPIRNIHTLDTVAMELFGQLVYDITGR